MSHQDTYNEYSNGAQPAAPSSQDGARGRSRSRSPARNGGSGSYRSPAPRSPNGGGGGGGSGSYRRRSPGPRKPNHAPSNPTPSNVLGVFGLSIRTQERDLQDEFNRFGRVEKVTIVYDQRTDRSRGFGFIVMSSVDEATRCIQELNGVEMNGRRIRVDFSVTERPHAPTPGEYMGLRRSDYGDSRRDRRDYRRDDRGGRYDGDRDRDRYDHDRRDDRDRDRDYRDYRDSKDWRDKRSPRGSRYSPRRRSRSRSPRGASPTRFEEGPRW
ncbi:hypothetical protein FRC18_000350 [Serendipita sp. 400]|nr:hypothetical protein FRC18_000350 [Serendipita sp. 400]